MEAAETAEASVKAGDVVNDNNDPPSTLIQHKTTTTNIMLTLIGGIELNVLCYLPLLDPVEKSLLKRKYLDEDIATVQQLCTAYESMGIMCNYQLLAQDVKEALRVKGANLRDKRLDGIVKVAMRPQSSEQQQHQYESLKRDINHFVSTCCQPRVLYQLVCNLESCLNFRVDYEDAGRNRSEAESFLRNSAETMKRCELWINNADRFEYHTIRPYGSHYRDFVAPVLCAITNLRSGFHGLSVAVKGRRDSIMQLPNGLYTDITGNRVGLDAFLMRLIALPNPIKGVVHDLIPMTKQEDVGGSRANIYPLLEQLPGGTGLLFKYGSSYSFRCA